VAADKVEIAPIWGLLGWSLQELITPWQLGAAVMVAIEIQEPNRRKSISLADFRELTGSSLGQRVAPYYEWQSSRRLEGTWVYDKTLRGAPLPECSLIDGCGRQLEGANYCSQDYLSLSSHEAVKDAAKAALAEFGCHSAGSSALLGNTSISRKLERELAAFVGYDHVLLFPTGWAAGYGVVKALVRPGDWVVTDALSHACLQEGARAATSNVASFPHLDNTAFEKRLSRIRASHPDAFILAITEALFSMDSDTPDLRRFAEICDAYRAVSLVDVAHDLGCLAENGGGQLENQRIEGVPDLLIGSFSKTFASNGGFITTKDFKVKEYLKMYSCPQTFSNALSPVAAAVVFAALQIVRSAEGTERRRRLLQNSVFLREKLTAVGFECLGEASAIVPVFLGSDQPGRMLWKALSDLGVASNFVEYPGVATNRSRLRLQLQCAHTESQAEHFVHKLAQARSRGAFSAAGQDFDLPRQGAVAVSSDRDHL
jgi:glycine C-acetyltransferase